MNQTYTGISWSSSQPVEKTCNLMILITPTTTAALCLCSQKGLFGSERVGARHGQINCRAGKPRSSCSSRVLEHSRSKQPPHRAKKKSPAKQFLSDQSRTHRHAPKDSCLQSKPFFLSSSLQRTQQHCCCR
jgi:hypothetical protein